MGNYTSVFSNSGDYNYPFPRKTLLSIPMVVDTVYGTANVTGRLAADNIMQGVASPANRALWTARHQSSTGSFVYVIQEAQGSSPTYPRTSLHTGSLVTGGIDSYFVQHTQPWCEIKTTSGQTAAAEFTIESTIRWRQEGGDRLDPTNPAILWEVNPNIPSFNQLTNGGLNVPDLFQ